MEKNDLNNDLISNDYIICGKPIICM